MLRVGENRSTTNVWRRNARTAATANPPHTCMLPEADVCLTPKQLHFNTPRCHIRCSQLFFQLSLGPKSVAKHSIVHPKAFFLTPSLCNRGPMKTHNLLRNPTTYHRSSRRASLSKNLGNDECPSAVKPQRKLPPPEPQHNRGSLIAGLTVFLFRPDENPSV